MAMNGNGNCVNASMMMEFSVEASTVSNGATTCSLCASNSINDPTAAGVDAINLGKLGCNLEKLLIDPNFDYSDAEIVVDGIPVGVHRCILSARSKFFHELFRKTSETSSNNKGKPQVYLDKLITGGKVGYEAFMIVLNFMYSGKLKPLFLEVSSCSDIDCKHEACHPAINFTVELIYASYIFHLEDLVLYFQLRLFNFVEQALAEDVLQILRVASKCKLTRLLSHCIHRVAHSNVDIFTIEKEVPVAATEEIKLLRLRSDPDEHNSAHTNSDFEQRARKIYKALDSDDVELVKLLLPESGVSLAETNGLHYAIAFCDAKIIPAVLELELQCINQKNQRGYTPLHMAAMRREPTIIGSLLDRGACPITQTEDGRCAVTICRRLTRAKDYSLQTPQGKETNKDKVCIEMLERGMRKNPVPPNECVSASITTYDLYMRLLYLEDRVALARLLFPAEAAVAMKIAQAEENSEFSTVSKLKAACGNLKELVNEAPPVEYEKLCSRRDSLMKTVRLGRRYFPQCSRVLDNYLDDEFSDSFSLDNGSPEQHYNGSPEEHRTKRLRFYELKEEVQRAFSRDKAESRSSRRSSSSSSSFH